MSSENNMPKLGSEYEVFLSFRGPDTRSGFTDHLYHRLNDAGIKVFRDDEELRKGEKIGSELLKAIEKSEIAIPIFSKGYAASKWCLRELAQIVESKSSKVLKVMPIFYDVTPSEVRHQTGDYAEAFKSHENEKQNDKDTIKSWKAALTEVGGLKGWDLSTGSPQGELVKEVTEVVLRELKKAYLIVSNHLVGVEDHVKNILGMLSTNINAVQILGIYGMGSIGKTTLAKEIYNRLLLNFECHSFLPDVRENYQVEGMKSLCKSLICDILGKQDISNVDDGIRIIREKFPNKKVVILMDDVDEIPLLDLHRLVQHDWFGCGSRIIITTRSKTILDLVHVDQYYPLDGLETNLALQLFSRHAFRKDDPPREFSIFSQKAVQIAGGLPLALEVFGSLLCGKSSEVWDFTLKQLQKVPYEDIRRKLNISFEALELLEKQIFLDVACFFIGKDYGLVVHFWEDPHDAMEILQQKSLVKIKDNKLWMHDQLRDLGRHIVQKEHIEPEKRSRLWDKEEATKAFMRNMVGENVEGICLRLPGWSDKTSSTIFASLPNLRLLRAECVYTYHEALDSLVPESYPSFPRRPFLFSKLRWLKWKWFPEMRDAENNISFENLAILELAYSDITSSWGGWSGVKMAKNLKVLKLTTCSELVKTPDLSCHPLLEQLILRRCYSLVKIDKSISKLKHLVIIDLHLCDSLRKLPKELSCMESLEELNINSTSIVEIPSWPLMRKLRVLDSSCCRSLKNFSSLDFAIHITELRLTESSITILPDSIGKLRKLQKLSLQGCRGIKTLPESIGDLVSLVELVLSYSRIVELPDTIGNLRNLKTLDISLTPLRRLPTTVGMMENLLSIDVTRCFELHDIPKLPQSLIKLAVSQLKTSKIPDLSNLINLKHLQLRLVDKPNDLLEADGFAPWWIGRFINLETLKLKSKRIISLHEDLGMLSYLRELKLSCCTELRSISKLPSSLTILHINRCSSLETLLDLSHLKKLSSLKIYDAPIRTLNGLCSHELQELVLNGCEVSKIDDLYMLKNLGLLSIEGCGNLRILSDLSNLKKLKHLDVVTCPNLVKILGINMLENLTSLSIEDCVKLQSLPGLSNLKKLKDLKVQNLVEIPSIEMSENLEKLSIVDCAKLQSLSGLSNLKKLKDLQVRSCPNLVEIPGIDMLKNLEELSIVDCAKLQSLSGLSNLKKLMDLQVRSCPNLVEITGRLKPFCRLTLMDCQSLEKFPNMTKTNDYYSYFNIHIENCGNKDESSLKLCTCIEPIYMYIITVLSSFFRCYLCNNGDLKLENSPDEQAENSLDVDSKDDDLGSA